MVAPSPHDIAPGSLVLLVCLNWWQQTLALKSEDLLCHTPSFETQSLRDSWMPEKLPSSGLWFKGGIGLALWCPRPHSGEVILNCTCWQSFLVRLDPTAVSCHWISVLLVNPLQFHFWGWISDLDLGDKENLLEILQFGQMDKERKFSLLLLTISTVEAFLISKECNI